MKFSLHQAVALAMLAALSTGCSTTVVASVPTPTAEAQALTAIDDADFNALSDVQFAALSEAQLAALTPSQIATISVLRLSLLSPSQRGALIISQFYALTIAQVRELPPSLLAALTPAQLGKIQPVKAQAVTAVQIAALSAEQAAALKLAAESPEVEEGPNRAAPPPQAPPAFNPVLNAAISLSNLGPFPPFAAGQFGFVPNPTQPPVILPKPPGIVFTPPVSFSGPPMTGAGAAAAKAAGVDCEVRYRVSANGLRLQQTPLLPTGLQVSRVGPATIYVNAKAAELNQAQIELKVITDLLPGQTIGTDNLAEDRRRVEAALANKAKAEAKVAAAQQAVKEAYALLDQIKADEAAGRVSTVVIPALPAAPGSAGGTATAPPPKPSVEPKKDENPTGAKPSGLAKVYCN